MWGKDGELNICCRCKFICLDPNVTLHGLRQAMNADGQLQALPPPSGSAANNLMLQKPSPEPLQTRQQPSFLDDPHSYPIAPAPAHVAQAQPEAVITGLVDSLPQVQQVQPEISRQDFKDLFGLSPPPSSFLGPENVSSNLQVPPMEHESTGKEVQGQKHWNEGQPQGMPLSESLKEPPAVPKGFEEYSEITSHIPDELDLDNLIQSFPPATDYSVPLISQFTPGPEDHFDFSHLSRGAADHARASNSQTQPEPKKKEQPEAPAERKLSPGAYEGQYTGNDEEVARAWIGEVTGEALEGPLQECLKSGVVLCKLVNKIKSNTIPRINMGPMPFPQRENVNAFCEAARSMGVPDKDNFTTADLFDNRNFKQVLVCIFSFGRQCYFVPGWSGPCLGRPEMAKLGPSRSFGKGESK